PVALLASITCNFGYSSSSMIYTKAHDAISADKIAESNKVSGLFIWKILLMLKLSLSKSRNESRSAKASTAFEVHPTVDLNLSLICGGIVKLVCGSLYFIS